MAENISCQLVHHGAAASSSPHSVVWIKEEEEESNTAEKSSSSSVVVYSSHGIVNVARSMTAVLSNGTQESVWHVESTLRTSTVGATKRVVTCLAHVRPVNDSSTEMCLGTGFSDGTVNTWCRNIKGKQWEERVLVEPPSFEHSNGRAITDMDGLLLSDQLVALVTCTADGAFLLQSSSCASDETTTQRLASFATNTVRLQPMPFHKIMILIGTAHPRHNKIHVYTTSTGKSADRIVHHCGHLSGHQDWITCFDWHMDDTPMLASGSQDAKIRLWKFTTSNVVDSSQNDDNVLPAVSNDYDSDDLELSDAEDDFDDEARLEILHENAATSVTLEALLLGHEEAVTSVNWHPNPVPYFGHPLILISSSMDRTLLVWGPTDDSGGVWTPLTRVGSAGGILGGSIGSSLLGFVNAAVEPDGGTRLLGHAYGGALHFWSLENSVRRDTDNAEAFIEGNASMDDLASRNKWRATPCLTGHFDGVTDLCWEADAGAYLLTASTDQTCRLWAPVQTNDGKDVWVEVARPQVHGYDLNAVTSVSSRDHRHLLASGADEKELRVFDAPLTTIRILQVVCSNPAKEETATKRVERAYVPSLGLSNKATAGDSVEEETGGTDGGSEWGSSMSTDQLAVLHLPLERDLGVVSLWPEVRKLFGHNTELFCLTSTVSSRSGPKWYSSPYSADVIVASSAKARDVEAASIHIWNVEEGKCIQVLTGGHRSTVATLSFSPDGCYLASSGKDRRLCVWRREEIVQTSHETTPSFTLVYAIDSAHKRIIWSVHFCPHYPSILASGSRDGCIKIWKLSEKADKENKRNETIMENVHSFEPLTRLGKKADSVTALAFAPCPISAKVNGIDCAVLAVGLESGVVELWAVPIPGGDVQEEKSTCSNLHRIPSSECHFSTITKLAWRPLGELERGDKSQQDIPMLLATASTDHGCRIFEVHFNSY